VACDGADYVAETKVHVQAVVEREFRDAVVYLADVDPIPGFGTGGTFCVEAAASAVDTSDDGYGNVVVGLRIWTYAGRRAGAGAEGQVCALAQRLEAALLAATGRAGHAGWRRTEYLETTYVRRARGRGFGRRLIPASRTEWRVRLRARRG
jgi:hypothetical protein